MPGTRGELPERMLHNSIQKSPAKKRQPKIARNTNSVEALRGHPLGERVLVRQAELEDELEKLDEGSVDYIAIDTALSTIDGFLGADMDHLSDATAHDLNTWLERNKFIGLSAVKRAH
jgi:hypothetical protein